MRNYNNEERDTRELGGERGTREARQQSFALCCKFEVLPHSFHTLVQIKFGCLLSLLFLASTSYLRGVCDAFGELMRWLGSMRLR